MAASGSTGTPLPQRKRSRATLTTRTLNGAVIGAVRVSVCHTFPVTLSTSTMPYSADPAVSGTATIAVSSAVESGIRQLLAQKPRSWQKPILRRVRRLDILGFIVALPWHAAVQ